MVSGSLETISPSHFLRLDYLTRLDTCLTLYLHFYSNSRVQSEMPNSPSKRWITTAGSDMEAVAAIRRDTEDTDSNRQRQEALRSRKLANTQTSILFGNASVDYQSDARSSQNNVMQGFDVEERQAQGKRNKDMKAQLTRANFSLGDEKVDYDSTAHSGLRNGANGMGGRQERCRPSRESSIQFGAEKNVEYRSVAQDSMVYHGNANDFEASRKNVVALKTHLRRHQISLGEEKVEYVTDNQRGYPSLDSSNYDHKNRKMELRKVIEESQACHFSLGQDKTEYLSNTHRSQNTNTGVSAADIAQEAANAKRMKQQLQRTSFEVGTDPEYL